MDKLNKSKSARYQRLNAQLKDLFKSTDNIMSRLATVEAILHHKIKYYSWTGIYLLVDGELLVHSYQGSVACQKLAKDKGVCWAAINQNETLVIPDVHDFPGHIACDSATNSEIVLPLKDKNGNIIGVFDVDSREFNSFNKVDTEELEKILDMVNAV